MFLRIDTEVNILNTLINDLSTLNDLITISKYWICGQYQIEGSGQYTQWCDVQFRGSSTGQKASQHLPLEFQLKQLPTSANRIYTTAQAEGWLNKKQICREASKVLFETFWEIKQESAVNIFAIMKTNCTLHYIRRSVPIRSSEIIVLIYLVLENDCPIWGSKQNTNILENV